jgi:hypothetical protein
MSFHKNVDCFHFDPGVTEEQLCRVCGDKCEVQRNKMGATSYAESVRGKEHLHDYFYCAHAEQRWHEQVRQLLNERRMTNSNSIRQMLDMEIELILKTRQPTIADEDYDT